MSSSYADCYSTEDYYDACLIYKDDIRNVFAPLHFGLLILNESGHLK
jgi:hypothetical protein